MIKKDDSKNKKEKMNQSEKYYKIKADFDYLSKHYNYQITKELGRGGYGVVYKARSSLEPDKKFAIKINFNTVSRQLIYTEMAFLQLVKNKSNLPKLLNLFVYNDITHIVIEYFKFQPFISFFNTFTMDDVRHYLFELLKGLKNLKDLGIFHRDIKPGNFLYNTETKKGVIIDFGLAQIDLKYERDLSEKVAKMKQEGKEVAEDEARLKIYQRLAECLKIIGKNKIGTETYMPLQSIMHHQHQNYQSDLWPVGVIFLQFVTRKYNIFNNVRMVNKPNNVKSVYYINYIMELANFYGNGVVEQCRNLGYELKIPKDLEKGTDFKEFARIDNFDEDAQDLLKGLLNLNPEKRITVERALEHPFFKKVREYEQANEKH